MLLRRFLLLVVVLALVIASSTGEAQTQATTFSVNSANDADDGGADSGAAYVFRRSGTTWTQDAKLTASDAAAVDQFGYSASLSGNTAVVGARHDYDAGSQSG